MRLRTLTIGIALLGASALAPPAASAAVNFSFSSADSTKVLFITDDRLLAADTDADTDAYMSVGGTLSLVSAPGAGAAGPSSDAFAVGLSADGSKAYFNTGERMVAADTDSSLDVYERSGGTTSLVSSPGAGASGASALATFKRSSADGSTAVFETAESLVAADTDTLTDLYQRSGGTTTLVSALGAGSSGPPQIPTFAGISADGSRVFFITTENLVGADTDGLLDVYERSGVTTTLISAPGAGASGAAAGSSLAGSSPDGARVYFTTTEKLVGSDADSSRDAYLRSGGVTTLISEPGAGASGPEENVNFGGESSDGGIVFFETNENLVAADTDGEFDIYGRSGGVTTLASPDGAGASGPASGVNYLANSPDGSTLLFDTEANLVTADIDALTDVYQNNGGVTTLRSGEGLGASGPFDNADFAGASTDASIVFLQTAQNMLAADIDNLHDVYQASGGGIALSSAPGPGASGPASASSHRANSADGSRMVFVTSESLTGADVDGGGAAGIDLYDRDGGVTTLLTAEPGPPLGSPPDTTITGTAPNFSFSADETPVTFQCSTDGAPFAACTSPQTLPALAPGGHTFSAKATDSSGNVEAAPAVASFTIPSPSVPAPAPTPKKCKKGQKLKKVKGKKKCVKKTRKKRK
jgi:Tol biopolymer transport system component